MTATIGTILLLTTGILATIGISERFADKNWRAVANFGGTFGALLCLIYAYVASDYSIVNVYQNSHHLKPLIYKISGAWGNHEGSMLLLLVILTGYSLFFALFDQSEFKNEALRVQNAVIALFTAFTLFASNPFERIFPTPSQGLGLNPLLQDIGLALHPPLLYTGYIGFFAVFSLALAGLLREKIDGDLASLMRPWLFFSWGFLTLGIGMGSWWAYRELGWGGYWFWDPVENVSLMPWIAATALIHSVKMLKRDEMMKIWTVLLAIITFILCLLGIFLVRSGLLTSVHSFAVDAKRGFFIILLIALIGGSALALFAAKMSKISQKTGNFGFFSQKMMILLNNYFLMVALFTVLVGVFYPIIARDFFDNAISVGASYYNKVFAILLLPFLTFMAISYRVSRKFWLFLVISGVFSLLLVKNLDFLAVFLIFLVILVILLAVFSQKNIANLGHLGFGLVLLGVILSSYLGQNREINMKEGQKIAINSSQKLLLSGIEYGKGDNFVLRQVVFEVLTNEKINFKLKPQLRYYPITDQTTFEPAIKHSIGGDLYIAAGNQDEQGNFAVRIYTRPFIYLIWLGCLAMFLAGGIGVTRISLIKK